MALKERRGQDIVMTVSKASDASGDGTVALTLTLAFCSRLEALPSCAGYINTQTFLMDNFLKVKTQIPPVFMGEMPLSVSISYQFF